MADKKSNNLMLHELAGINPERHLSNNALLKILYARQGNNGDGNDNPLRLVSPDGTVWLLTLDDEGHLITIEEAK